MYVGTKNYTAVPLQRAAPGQSPGAQSREQGRGREPGARKGRRRRREEKAAANHPHSCTGSSGRT
jgi:hypothetical protein